MGRDVTDMKQLEEQLRQAQKMEAIGTLAGGIAHDFNNILSSILGFTELSLDEVEKGSHLHDNLNEVFIAGKRARDLVRQILTFSRQSDGKTAPMDMGTVAREATALLRASTPTTVQMETEIPEKNLIIEGDATQIHQVIMNLCTNAAQAMEEAGGRLAVTLERVELGAKDDATGPTSGKYVLLTVSDTGCGMAPDVTERIFDPYFTTRETGKGSGMGLALVHGIVASHHGHMDVETSEGKGSVFRVYLPLLDQPEGVSELLKGNELPRGHEHILVVDDEPQIVNFQKQVLKRLGYRVKAKTDSMAALAAFRSAPGTFDALITDMTMPRMTGEHLARELREIRPDIPVIPCTGYSDNISKETAMGMGINAFLMKPVDRTDLAKALRKILDG